VRPDGRGHRRHPRHWQPRDRGAVAVPVRPEAGGRAVTPARLVLLLVLAVPLLPAATVHAQEADDYAAMLDYLAQTRIDDRAFNGANGAIAINMAAGDLNQQANQRSIAVGQVASASVGALQRSQANVATAPDHAFAAISGNAFQGASGLVSINQRSEEHTSELQSREK